MLTLKQAMAKCPPQNKFRLPGQIAWALFVHKPDFIRPHKHTGRRAQGVRYEKKVQEYLTGRFPEYYVPCPWLQFWTSGSPRWCQPDGILIQPREGRITLVEVKYQHTSDAWWQLRWLYGPVVQAIFDPREWEYQFLEVVKWYDPATVFPEKVRLAEDPIALQPNEFGVHIWNQ